MNTLTLHILRTLGLFLCSPPYIQGVTVDLATWEFSTGGCLYKSVDIKDPFSNGETLCHQHFSPVSSVVQIDGGIDEVTEVSFIFSVSAVSCSKGLSRFVSFLQEVSISFSNV